MKLHFHGAVHGVTGSCYVVETPSGLLMIDCGMFQGGRKQEEENRVPFGFDPKEIKWVILTHAHIDHSGRIPLLVKEGYSGPIFATRATCGLADIMLRDSAHIQEEDAAYEQKKWRRGQLDERPTEPLYTIADAEAAQSLFHCVPYGEAQELSENISVRLVDAGHILGSANVELTLREGERQFRLTFSGDIGTGDNPILRDPEPLSATDFLVMESTYGDRMHEDSDHRVDRLQEVVAGAIQRKGCVIIPSFSVGRTQELLYYLNSLVEGHALKAIPMFVDSPLALEATRVFSEHPECFNQVLSDQIARGDDPFDFPNLHFSRTVDDSKAINSAPPPYVVISAAGMCNAGRIRHHLLNHLGNRQDTVLFVGYQAKETLGRRLEDGLSPIRIMGETVRVRATITSIEGFSAHADRAGLLSWFGKLPQPPGYTFVTHGEPPASFSLRDALAEQYHAAALVPDLGQVADLSLDNRDLAAQVQAQANRPATPAAPGDETAGEQDG